MTDPERLAAIYARIPALKCQRKCQQACGPIGMSKREWEAMGKPGPAMRDSGTVYLIATEDLTCPVLSEATGQCRRYANRPLICRLWGVVREMACPHGCQPERWLTDEEARKMLREVAEL